MKEEHIDVIDENDNVIDTVTRSKIIQNNLRHRCCFFMVFNSKEELLITKRTKMMAKYPGLYEIPGGILSAGESYEGCAYREIKEELGIKDIELKFLFNIHYEDKNTKEIFKVYSCTYDGEIQIQEEEIEDYFFITLRKLKEMIEKEPSKFPPNRIKIIETYLQNENKAIKNI